MPYISVKTSSALTPQQKAGIQAELGKLISVIPGKSESVLMTAVEDNVSMRFRGESVPCAYVDVVCYGAVQREAKQEFTRQASAMLADQAEISLENVYLTYTEKDCWGMGGNLV